MTARRSSALKQAIWLVIAAIPHGRVCTYGDIANMAGQPGQARWVGRLLSELPPDSTLPWHRVVNASGKITHPNASKQVQRLQDEGIQTVHQRVALKRYRWQP